MRIVCVPQFLTLLSMIGSDEIKLLRSAGAASSVLKSMGASDAELGAMIDLMHAQQPQVMEYLQSKAKFRTALHFGELLAKMKPKNHCTHAVYAYYGRGTKCGDTEQHANLLDMKQWPESNAITRRALVTAREKCLEAVDDDKQVSVRCFLITPVLCLGMVLNRFHI
jgi:hypothetical protein